MVLNIFTELCAPHRSLIPEHFHHTEHSHYPLAVIPVRSSLKALETTHLLSVCIEVPISSNPFQHLLLSIFFLKAILVSHCGVIYISLMINNIEYLQVLISHLSFLGKIPI